MGLMKGYKQFLKELPSKKVVFTFGRFNPPTTGHELLVKAVKKLAVGSSYVIYVSKTQDSKKNPLPVDRKIYYLNRMFPSTNFVAADNNVRTFIEAAKQLNKKYKDIIMVAGSDRVKEFKDLLDKYNGKDFKFDSIQVISAGERDPDSDDATGMSATKMRDAAKKGDFNTFKRGLPTRMTKLDARRLMNEVRDGMGLGAVKESIKFTVDEIREKYFQGEIFNVGEIVESEDAYYKIVKRGSNHLLLENTEGKYVSKWLQDVAPLDQQGKETAEVIEELQEMDNVKFSALDKVKIARVIATALGVDGAQKKTNPEMLINYGLREIRKRALSRNGYSILLNMLKTADMAGIKYDKKLIPPQASQVKEASSPAQQAAIAIAMKKAGKEPKNEEVEDLEENAAVRKKAEKSGMSYSTLMKVYRRGVAAWNSGHRPGTTPEQWGLARVNSYATKGKGTYHGADKDLREEEQIEEKLKSVAKDKDTGLAKKYVAGLSKSTAAARKAHWDKADELSDKDPEAYKPAPGDATAKTKESKHTKKFKDMYGEEKDNEQGSVVKVDTKSNYNIAKSIMRYSDLMRLLGKKDSKGTIGNSLNHVDADDNLRKRKVNHHLGEEVEELEEAKKAINITLKDLDVIKSGNLEAVRNHMRKLIQTATDSKKNARPLRHDKAKEFLDTINKAHKVDDLQKLAYNIYLGGDDAGKAKYGSLHVYKPISKLGRSYQRRYGIGEEVEELEEKSDIDTSKPKIKLKNDEKLLGVTNAKAYDAFFEEDDEDEDMDDETLDKMADELDDDEMIDAGYDDDEIAIVDDETGEEIEDEDDEEDDEEKKEKKVNEEALDEVLSRMERIRARQRLMRTKSKRQRAEKIALRKFSSSKVVNNRARRLAVKALKKRFTRGRPLNRLSVAEKERLEARVQRLKPILNRLALRMIPKVRKLEKTRLSHKKFTK